MKIYRTDEMVAVLKVRLDELSECANDNRIEDIEDIWDEIEKHFDELKIHIESIIERSKKH